MSREHVEKCVTSYVEAIHEKLDTGNIVKCFIAKKPARPWLADTNSDNFQAAIKAVTDVWGIAPDLTREGGSIPSEYFSSKESSKNIRDILIRSFDMIRERLDLTSLM